MEKVESSSFDSEKKASFLSFFAYFHKCPQREKDQECKRCKNLIQMGENLIYSCKFTEKSDNKRSTEREREKQETNRENRNGYGDMQRNYKESEN